LLDFRRPEPEALLPVLKNLAYHFKRIGLEAGPLSQRALVGGVAGSPRRHSAPALQERSLIENRTGSTAPGRAPQHGPYDLY
jgi:hypothetical protein